MTDNSLMQNVLRDCYSQLITNLNPDLIINHFWERRLITDGEKDQLSKPGQSENKQTSEFLDALRKKSNFVLDELIEYLMLDKSKDFLVTLLENSKSVHLGGVKQTSSNKHRDDVGCRVRNVTNTDNEDFELTYNRASKVIPILTNDPNILKNWSIIVELFLTKALDRFEISNIDHPHQKIKRTLEIWISHESPTFNSLIKLLGGYTKVVEDLEINKDEIRNSGASLKERKISSGFS